MILTRQRIRVLCHINRWRGWTHQPYSVGQHTAIGAWVLDWFRSDPELIKAWWMHDLHETEFCGDIPTPDKEKYTNANFRNDVCGFDERLGVETKLSPGWWLNPKLKRFDFKIMCVENDLIVSRKDPELPKPDYENDEMAKMIRQYLESSLYTNPHVVIELYRSHARAYGWVEI